MRLSKGAFERREKSLIREKNTLERGRELQGGKKKSSGFSSQKIRTFSISRRKGERGST